MISSETSAFHVGASTTSTIHRGGSVISPWLAYSIASSARGGAARRGRAALAALSWSGLVTLRQGRRGSTSRSGNAIGREGRSSAALV